MVIDDRGTACPGRIDQRQQRRIIDILAIQCCIELPPKFRQNFFKITCRCTGWRKAPCKSGIEMMMGVDQTRHDNTAPGINAVIGRAFDSR